MKNRILIQNENENGNIYQQKEHFNVFYRKEPMLIEEKENKKKLKFKCVIQ
jgi:hypothetical protein